VKNLTVHGGMFAVCFGSFENHSKPKISERWWLAGHYLIYLWYLQKEEHIS